MYYYYIDELEHLFVWALKRLFSMRAAAASHPIEWVIATSPNGGTLPKATGLKARGSLKPICRS